MFFYAGGPVSRFALPIVPRGAVGMDWVAAFHITTAHARALARSVIPPPCSVAWAVYAVESNLTSCGDKAEDVSEVYDYSRRWQQRDITIVHGFEFGHRFCVVTC